MILHTHSLVLLQHPHGVVTSPTVLYSTLSFSPLWKFSSAPPFHLVQSTTLDSVNTHTMAPKNSEPSMTDAVTQLAIAHSTSILWTLGFFTAGVLFIKSSLMDNLAPQ